MLDQKKNKKRENRISNLNKDFFESVDLEKIIEDSRILSTKIYTHLKENNFSDKNNKVSILLKDAYSIDSKTTDLLKRIIIDDSKFYEKNKRTYRKNKDLTISHHLGVMNILRNTLVKTANKNPTIYLTAILHDWLEDKEELILKEIKQEKAYKELASTQNMMKSNEIILNNLEDYLDEYLHQIKEERQYKRLSENAIRRIEENCQYLTREKGKAYYDYIDEIFIKSLYSSEIKRNLIRKREIYEPFENILKKHNPEKPDLTLILVKAADKVHNSSTMFYTHDPNKAISDEKVVYDAAKNLYFVHNAKITYKFLKNKIKQNLKKNNEDNFNTENEEIEHLRKLSFLLVNKTIDNLRRIENSIELPEKIKSCIHRRLDIYKKNKENWNHVTFSGNYPFDGFLNRVSLWFISKDYLYFKNKEDFYLTAYTIDNLLRDYYSKENFYVKGMNSLRGTEKTTAKIMNYDKILRKILL